MSANPGSSTSPVPAFKEASLRRRFAAIAIDSYSSYLVATAVVPHHQGMRLLMQLSILFAEISLLTSLQGASFGQMVLRLRVVDSRDGKAVSILRILLRCLMIIAVLPAIFRHEGRSVHDVLTHSIVVKVVRTN